MFINYLRLFKLNNHSYIIIIKQSIFYIVFLRLKSVSNITAFSSLLFHCIVSRFLPGLTTSALSLHLLSPLCLNCSNCSCAGSVSILHCFDPCSRSFQDFHGNSMMIFRSYQTFLLEFGAIISPFRCLHLHFSILYIYSEFQLRQGNLSFRFRLTFQGSSSS